MLGLLDCSDFFLRLGAKSQEGCGLLPRFDCFDFFDFRGQKPNKNVGCMILIKNRGNQTGWLGGPGCDAPASVRGKKFRTKWWPGALFTISFRAGRILPALALPASRREGSGMTT
jgi:hypothetical protein